MGAPLKPRLSVAGELSPAHRSAFAELLNIWYRQNARNLPWRGIADAYRTWVSEIMLQQTRVSAVIEHFKTFIGRFPTVVALALAREDEVLALWSGLGYYRRARMLHKAAQFLVREHGGTMPSTAVELRRLPGIGTYTGAAIASIAFGERVAVVDGNVERVLLRIAGRPDESTQQCADFVADFAQILMPGAKSGILPGDHNQAMMELGATVCLPRGPLCLQCPVYDLCQTRGEHLTPARAPMRSERIFYALTTRKARNGIHVEVLLHRRPADLSLMPGMLELPPLRKPPSTPTVALAASASATSSNALISPSDAGQQPLLRVRHAIVGTNYYVEVFAIPDRAAAKRNGAPADELLWVRTGDLRRQPLTGLARKALQRLGLMPSALGEPAASLPLIIGRHNRVGTDVADTDE